MALLPSTIAERWSYWLPFVTMDLKRYIRSREFNPSGSPLNRFKLIHERTIACCESAGLPLETIVKHSLDDPRLTDKERARRIAQAIERRRSRMGRVKGQVRARYDQRSLTNANGT